MYGFWTFLLPARHFYYLGIIFLLIILGYCPFSGPVCSSSNVENKSVLESSRMNLTVGETCLYSISKATYDIFTVSTLWVAFSASWLIVPVKCDAYSRITEMVLFCVFEFHILFCFTFLILIFLNVLYRSKCICIGKWKLLWPQSRILRSAYYP